jgi:hypothetical protein
VNSDVKYFRLAYWTHRASLSASYKKPSRVYHPSSV